jgi:DNA-binding phage protein
MSKSLEKRVEALGRSAAAERKLALAPLREGLDAMLAGDVEAGKAFLRDYIKAAIGFEQLGTATGIPPKSLIRMFGRRGNPQARNLFAVICHLQQRARVSFHVAP